MTPINWTRDWSKASTEDIADAVSVMPNLIGKVEQAVLTEASELLWQLADWENNPERELLNPLNVQNTATLTRE